MQTAHLLNENDTNLTLCQKLKTVTHEQNELVLTPQEMAIEVAGRTAESCIHCELIYETRFDWRE